MAMVERELTGFKKWARYLVVVLWIVIFLFWALWNDWDEDRIGAANRLKTTQFMNILMLWTTIKVGDWISTGETLERLNNPTNSEEFKGTALYYGCAFLATALVMCWANS